MNKKMVELLAPAGSFEALVAGCESGADAVYLGGQRFSARASANNFSEEELAEAVRYAHIRDVKIYVTVNTLVSDEELETVMDYVDYLYKLDVDALILQDIGLAKRIKESYPDFEIHGSTQMTIHDSEGALMLKEMGFSRIVAARELGADEIKELSEETGMDIEVFVHGALCVSWSGQCLLSSLIGGRSGNRGRCAQPCRRKYKRVGGGLTEEKSSYAISTRDLNTIEHIDEILESGATSLKIEGRMKNPEYVGITVANYRKAIDGKFEKGGVDNIDTALYELRASFNREFTKGYILGEQGAELVNEERPDNRGIFIGRVISQKGNFLRIKLEESFVNDGDGIEIEGSDGYSGVIISGMNVNAKPGKTAKAGDTAEVFTGRTFEVGSKVRKTLDSELQKKAQEVYMEKNQRRIELTGLITLAPGEKGVFEIKDKNGNVGKSETVELIQTADKKPASMETLSGNLEKTGDTPFVFTELRGEITGNCFIPVSVVNELRRAAIADLEEKRSLFHPNRLTLINGKEKDLPGTINKIMIDETHDTNEISTIELSEEELSEDIEIICRVENLSQGNACIEAGGRIIDMKWDSFHRVQPADKSEKLKALREKGADEVWAVLPNIIKVSENGFLPELIELKKNGSIDGVVANGIGMVHWARNHGIPYRGGSSLNIFNREATAFYSDSTGIQLSEELNFLQMKELIHNRGVENKAPYFECKVYGRAVAMTLDYCPFETEGCHKNCGILKGACLEDNTNRAFPLRRSLGHRVQLLNSSCLLVFKELESFRKAGISRFILDFTSENKEMLMDTVAGFISPELRKSEECPVLVKESMESGAVEYTKGHYFRGVL